MGLPFFIERHKKTHHNYGGFLCHLTLARVDKVKIYFTFIWWGRRDSNSYTLRRWNLNPVRLPISPRPQNWVLQQYLAEDQGLEP